MNVHIIDLVAEGVCDFDLEFLSLIWDPESKYEEYEDLRLVCTDPKCSKAGASFKPRKLVLDGNGEVDLKQTKKGGKVFRNALKHASTHRAALDHKKNTGDSSRAKTAYQTGAGFVTVDPIASMDASLLCQGFFPDPLNAAQIRLLDVPDAGSKGDKPWFGSVKERCFRSGECLKFAKTSALADAVRTKDKACSCCAEIPSLRNFQRQVQTSLSIIKETKEHGLRLDGVNHSCRTHEEMMSLIRDTRVERGKNRLMILNQGRTILSLNKRLDKFLFQGDTLQFIKDFVLLERTGGWEKKPALRDMVFDLVGAAARAQRADETNNPKLMNGMRYHKRTLNFVSAQLALGSARAVRLFANNIGGPSERTFQANLFKDTYHLKHSTYDLAPNILFVLKLFDAARAAAGISPDVWLIVHVPEDETAIPCKFEYHNGYIVGGCGARRQCHHACDCEREEGGESLCKCKHKCTMNDCTLHVSNDTPAMYQAIVDYVSEQMPANYARLMMLEVLNLGFPAIPVLVAPTCNRFDAKPHVLDQWEALEAQFAAALQGRKYRLIGHSSDGDARRAKLQLAEMKPLAHIAAQPEPQQLWLDAASFTYSAKEEELLSGEIVYGGVGHQDPLHNLGKIDAQMAGSKTLKIGDHLATANHLQILHESTEFLYAEHKLRKEYILRSDRQSKSAVDVRSSVRVRECLGKMREETAGTEALLHVISLYSLIFFSTKMTMMQRVKSAAYVVTFLRGWRAHARRNAETSSCLTPQTHRHVVLSCHAAVLTMLIARHLVSLNPSGADVPELHLCKCGSDACESCFSFCGGWGSVSSWQRNFTFAGMLRMLGRAAALEAYKAGADSLIIKKTHPKSYWNASNHEAEALPDCSYTDYMEPHSAYNAHWQEGVAEGLAKLTGLGLEVSADDIDGTQETQSDSDSDDDDDDDDGDDPRSEDEDDDEDGGGEEMSIGQAVVVQQGAMMVNDFDEAVSDVLLSNPATSKERHVQSVILPRVARAHHSDAAGEAHLEEEKRISVRTLLQVLQEKDIDWGAVGVVGAARCPTERLGRINALAAQAALGDQDTSLEGDFISIGTDVAFSFNVDGAAARPQIQVWFGRVMAMVSNKGRSISYRRPITPDDALSSKVKLLCNWYKATGVTGIYTYGEVKDNEMYPMDAYLGLVDVTHVDDNTYTIDAAQRAHFQRKLVATTPVAQASQARETQQQETLTQQNRSWADVAYEPNTREARMAAREAARARINALA